MIDLFPKKLFSLSLVFQMPVPMLIPSSMGNEDKVTKSIEEKLPSHPFEADLLEMAEIIAEDEEKEKTISQGGWYDFKGKKSAPADFQVNESERVILSISQSGCF